MVHTIICRYSPRTLFGSALGAMKKTTLDADVAEAASPATSPYQSVAATARPTSAGVAVASESARTGMVAVAKTPISAAAVRYQALSAGRPAEVPGGPQPRASR